jgi:NAD(P)-dependent dehydrogenase (short-subunit alcohol dehydrogenase family)
VNLAGRTALVTAAGRGIGRGIALALAEAGADLVVNSYGEDTTAAVAGEIEAMGRQVLARPGDITRGDRILEVVDAALERFGRIDVLVNNVGAGPKSAPKPEPGPLGPTAALWDALYAQNLRPVVLMSEAVIPHMKARAAGSIVNISSIAGKASLSDKLLRHFVHPSYGAMKAAVVSYTHTLAEMLGPSGIRVNAVCPGIVYTDAWRANAERAVETIPEFAGKDPRQWFEGLARGDYPDWIDRTPLRRPQTVEDIARAVRFLVSDDAANITGQSLMVDGGMIKL